MRFGGGEKGSCKEREKVARMVAGEEWITCVAERGWLKVVSGVRIFVTTVEKKRGKLHTYQINIPDKQTNKQTKSLRTPYRLITII